LQIVSQIVARLKWLLIGSLIATVVLVWAIWKGMRRSRRR
jgi:hypothetical protein